MAENQVFLTASGAINRVINPSLVITSAEQVFTETDVEFGGAISSDGVTITPNRSVEPIRQLSFNSVVRYSSTEEFVSVSLTLLEDSETVRNWYFGTEATAQGRIDWDLSKVVGGRFVVAFLDNKFGEVSDGRATRTVLYDFPNARITEMNELPYVNGQPTGYGLTIQADPGLDGITARVWRSTTTPVSE